MAINVGPAAGQTLIGASNAVVVLPDGVTYTIEENTSVDLTFEGNGTVILPTTLIKGKRFIMRLSLKAVSAKLLTVLNPNFSILGNIITLAPGDDLTLSPGDSVTLEAIATTELEIL